MVFPASAGVFVRGPLGTTTAQVQEIIDPHRAELERLLGVPAGNPRYAFEQRCPIELAGEDAWDDIADFIYREANCYAEVLQQVLGGSE